LTGDARTIFSRIGVIRVRLDDGGLVAAFLGGEGVR
jgi:hypothetical protein